MKKKKTKKIRSFDLLFVCLFVIELMSGVDVFIEILFLHERQQNIQTYIYIYNIITAISDADDARSAAHMK